MKAHVKSSEKEFTGKPGDVVSYQQNRKTARQKTPANYNRIPTQKQAAARLRFTAAQRFAHSVITDPVLKALYNRLAGKRCTAYSMAVSEYFVTMENGQWIL